MPETVCRSQGHRAVELIISSLNPHKFSHYLSTLRAQYAEEADFEIARLEGSKPALCCLRVNAFSPPL